jgi:hypothetical protein
MTKSLRIPGLINIKSILFLIILLTYNDNLFSQDTIRYIGTVGTFLYETIELHQDSTFSSTWTTDYDLSRTDYGLYEQNNKNIKLKYKLNDLDFRLPTTMTLKDTLININKIYRERNFKIINDKIYLLKANGKIVKRLKIKAFKSKWSWLTFGYQKLNYIKTDSKK